MRSTASVPPGRGTAHYRHQPPSDQQTAHFAPTRTGGGISSSGRPPPNNTAAGDPKFESPAAWEWFLRLEWHRRPACVPTCYRAAIGPVLSSASVWGFGLSGRISITRFVGLIGAAGSFSALAWSTMRAASCS